MGAEEVLALRLRVPMKEGPWVRTSQRVGPDLVREWTGPDRTLSYRHTGPIDSSTYRDRA